jgi:hypothetical protein
MMFLAMEDNMPVKSLSLQSLTDIGLDGFAQIMLTMLQYICCIVVVMIVVGIYYCCCYYCYLLAFCPFFLLLGVS